MANRIAAFVENDGTFRGNQRCAPLQPGDTLVDLAGNPVGGGQTPDIQAALDGANAPSAANVFATMLDISSLSGGIIPKGPWDASTGTYPSPVSNGWMYYVSVAGTTPDGKVWSVGDLATYLSTAWYQTPAPAIRRIVVSSVDSPTELRSVTGSYSSFLAIAYEEGDPNAATLYNWDPTTTAVENLPYLVRSGSGSWRAVGGSYLTGKAIVLSAGLAAGSDITAPNLQYVIASPTNNNLVAMDTDGKVKDSGVSVKTTVVNENVSVPTGAAVWAVISGGSSGGGTSSKETITQTSHGFVGGNAIYRTGGAYAKALADAAAHADVIGIVESVSGNDFVVVYSGRITVAGMSWADNTPLYLDATTAGLLTTTPPSTPGQVIKPLMIATGATTGVVNIMSGVVVGSAYKPVWSSITGTTGTLAGGNNYFIENASLTTVALPSSPSKGDEIRLMGIPGSGGWKITQPTATTQIIGGDGFTTVGTTGSLSSNGVTDGIHLVCVDATNNIWQLEVSTAGYITV